MGISRLDTGIQSGIFEVWIGIVLTSLAGRIRRVADDYPNLGVFLALHLFGVFRENLLRHGSVTLTNMKGVSQYEPLKWLIIAFGALVW